MFFFSYQRKKGFEMMSGINPIKPLYHIITYLWLFLIRGSLGTKTLESSNIFSHPTWNSKKANHFVFVFSTIHQIGDVH